MKNKKSFVSTMKNFLVIQILAVIFLLLLAVAAIFTSADYESRSTADNYLSIYKSQIENRIEKMNLNIAELLSEHVDLQLLSGDDESERVYAAQRIVNKMKSITAIDRSSDFIVVDEVESGVYLDIYNTNMKLMDRLEIREFLDKTVRDKDFVGDWSVAEIGGTSYLIRGIVKESRIVAEAVAIETLMDEISKIDLNNFHYLMTDSNGKIIACSENGYGVGRDYLGQNIVQLNTKTLVQKESIAILDGTIYLYSFGNMLQIWNHLRGSMILILVVVLLLCAFDFIFMKIEKNMVAVPMNQTIRDIAKIKGGDLKWRMRSSQNMPSLEFSTLSDTFNSMMDQIMELRVQSYEKQIALSDAEQKYIRLQIRPHFFLNAMTTILSLSNQGRVQDVEKYINALSKNIRYMFKAGLHTVAIRDEIYHVENYFEMQELRYPDSVSYFINMPDELGEWKVPQMLIHTIVENEYKYAITPGENLLVIIKISLVQNAAEEMLRIEIEDDGQGYPQEVLEQINGKPDLEKNESTRIGLWSIKRLLELMYDRDDLFLLENVTPHGAKSTIYIPKEPKNERGKEFLDESGIK